eukprot:scaffold50732_cov39-Phaeocystis_antarctica.AAC.1
MTASLRPSGSHAIRSRVSRVAPGSFPWAAKGAMKTSVRPVNSRLWAAREDPGLQSELGAECTRPTGGCHEHAALAYHPQVIGEGPVKKWLRAQRAGRLAPRRGGAKRRAAALGAAQRREAPPQAVERRASRK